MGTTLMAADQEAAAPAESAEGINMTLAQAPTAEEAIVKCTAHLQGLRQGFAGAAPGEGPQQDGQRFLILLQDPVQLLLALNLQHLTWVLPGRRILHRGP